MPGYDFVCTANSDHRKSDVIFPIADYDELTLKDKACQEPGCAGTYEHTFENARPGHSFKGTGWTEKFYR